MRIKTMIQKKFAIPAASAFTALVFTVPAFADTPTANTSLTSAAQTAVDQTVANINGILPIALGLMGIVMAILIGIRVFRRIANTSSR